jgi:hypothetical protein
MTHTSNSPDRAKGGWYMKKSKNRSIRKDWSNEGMEYLNDMFCQVREPCLTSLSTTNEVALKATQNKSSTRNKGCRETAQSHNDVDIGHDTTCVLILRYQLLRFLDYLCATCACMHLSLFL